MILDFEPLLSGEARSLGFDYEISSLGDDVPATVCGPFRVSGSAVDKAGYIALSLHARIPYKTNCARCAKELSRVMSLDHESGVASEESVGEDDTDYEILENGKLDLDEIVRRCFILELPMTELCSEDCLGLCSECGKDLNEGPCGCKKAVDPRIQKIIDAINKNNE